MPAPRAVNDEALQAAVQWRVRQEAGRFDAQAQRRFEQWLQADALHRQAWERVGATVLEGPLATVRAWHGRGDAGSGASAAQAVEQTLFRARRRRTLRGALAVAGMAGTAGLIAQRQVPLDELWADVHTRTAERRTFAWSDGAAALLDARSAADTTHTAEGRRFILRAGALVATPARGQSVTVETAYGTAVAHAGRLACRLQGDGLEVVAQEQGALLRTPAGQTARLQAGDGAHLSARGIERIAGPALARTAWQRGMLAAEDWSVGEVIDAVRPYTAGFLQVSAAAARLRVFGVFRLDADEVLDGLAYLLPLKIVHLGPWLRRVDVAAPA